MNQSKEFWELTASKCANRGYNAVCTPTAMGLFNWYTNFLHRQALNSTVLDCKGDLVLDAGCGVGRWTSKLCRAGATVTGIDISEIMIKEAISRSQLLRYDAHFAISNVANLPFRDSVFDHVLSVTVLHHIVDDSEIQKSIAELIRVTKKDGRIIALEIAPKEGRAVDIDCMTAYRSSQQWVSLFEMNNKVRLDSIQGVDPSIFVRLMKIMRRKFAGGVRYSYQDYIRDSTDYRPSVKFLFLKLTWYMLMNIAILLSIPLDPILRNRYQGLTNHRLFIFKKVID